jgi:UDP:flavonoid glycosyltransferase YjiC (YdhE family)
VVSDPDGLTRTILEAVAQADVHAIVSKGWSDRFSGDSGHSVSMDRPGVFEVPSIPHDWLFPRVDAVCHHG